MEYKIPLRNKNKEIVDYCLVSPEDFDILNKYKWYIGEGYVMGTINRNSWRIHRYIMIKILKHNQDNIKIDHINSNKLDNRRKNLRIVTHSENVRNSTKRKNTSSKYIGVSKNVIIEENTLYASYDIEEHAAYQYNLWIDKYEIIHAKKNDIEQPEDFVEHIKSEKNGGYDIPKGINLTKNGKFCVDIRKKYHGEFNTLEEAIKKMESIRKEFQDKKLESINNTPIKRNEKNECIIELFNNKKEKIGETIVDEYNYYNLKQYSWFKSHNYVCGRVNNKIVNLHRYIMNYTGKDFIDHINNNPLDKKVI